MRKLCTLLSCLLVFSLLCTCALGEGTAAANDPSLKYAEDMVNNSAKRAQENAPKITTLENGVRVQRTPVDAGGVWHRPGDVNGYNIIYLDADNRGCAACHPSMVKLIENMEYEHLRFNNNFGQDLTVMDCRVCHSYGTGYVEKLPQLGTLMHGIHCTSKAYDAMGGNCMTCHNATEDGKGLTLWDEVKYEVLFGITDVADVQGEFSYKQDVLSDAMYVNWMSSPEGRDRHAKGVTEMPPDQDLFDSWEITVTGAVDNPFTMKLADLIKEAPSETVTMAAMCVMNPSGGPYIQNTEVTGIPMSWLLEKAGAHEDATGFTCTTPGNERGDALMSSTEKYGSWLAYEINGEPIGWGQGFPCTMYNAASGIPSFVRRTSVITVKDCDVSELHVYDDGWFDFEGNHLNKPSVGIFHFAEGQIIKAGEPYTFEGYGYAINEQVTAIEFSLDQGKTWTSFDTSDSDLTKWVYWNFTYTPPAPGSYVLSVRGVTSEGLVSLTPDTIMFNAE